MPRILALDVGHTTGLYQGLLLTLSPHVFTITTAAIGYPPDSTQEKLLAKAIGKADYVVVEYPVINRISTLQKKTREVTNWWMRFATDHAEVHIVQPSQWKPTQHLAPAEILPNLGYEYSQHERDAARMAWWWSKNKYVAKGE